MQVHMLAVAGLVAGGVVAAQLTVTAPAPQRWKLPRQDYNSGEYLYRVFCTSCHGESGRGDGPVATLLIKRPPDLTMIAARNGGTFPHERVLAMIDGRTTVQAHGRREMPIWGDVMRATEGQDEATIRERVAALVRHLESMQTKNER